MTELSTDRLGGRADDVYAVLMAAHDDLGAADGAALNARLILVLANLVGDADRVIQAIALAKSGPSE